MYNTFCPPFFFVVVINFGNFMDAIAAACNVFQTFRKWGSGRHRCLSQLCSLMWNGVSAVEELTGQYFRTLWQHTLLKITVYYPSHRARDGPMSIICAGLAAKDKVQNMTVLKSGICGKTLGSSSTSASPSSVLCRRRWHFLDKSCTLSGTNEATSRSKNTLLTN